jgi:hypothetical protein
MMVVRVVNGETEYTSDNPEKVRQIRNIYLAETDWASGSDVTMSDAMRTYRQALRDIPQQPNFPNTFIMPVKPE